MCLISVHATGNVESRSWDEQMIASLSDGSSRSGRHEVPAPCALENGLDQ